MEFLYNYERALKSWYLIAGRVYNIDETMCLQLHSLLTCLFRLGKTD